MSLSNLCINLPFLSLILGVIGVISSLLRVFAFLKAKRTLRGQLKELMTKILFEAQFREINLGSFLIESVLKSEYDSQKTYKKILQLAINELDYKEKELVIRNFRSLSRLDRKNFVEELIEDADVKNDIKHIAIHCGDMGIMYHTHEELDKAVQMYNKSLKLNEILGRKEDMARVYGNLGSVYQTIGDMDKAVQMYEEKLKLNEILGQKEDIARIYGNLGFVYQIIGDMDKAEQMYKENLKLNEILGRKKGMAGIYCHLGFVYQIIGESDKAAQMWQISLKLNETLRRKEGMTEEYDNLDIIHETRRKLNEAKQRYQRSLRHENFDEVNNIN